MAQQKKKTYLEQLAVLTEKYHSKKISEKDYHMWLQVYTDQDKPINLEIIIGQTK